MKQKYYDYLLRTNTIDEMEMLAQGFGFDWNRNTLGSELTFNEDISIIETIEIPDDNDYSQTISVTQSVIQTRTIYVSIIGDLPSQDADGDIIYETMNSGTVDEYEKPVMSGKYHINARSTHKILNPAANSYEVKPDKPFRKFA